MRLRNIAILATLLIVADQLLKIWIKTTMRINEAIIIFPDWFQLRFVENNGAAFGMQLGGGSGFDWGKALLTSFRICMIGLLVWYIIRLVRSRAPKGAIVALTMILAGALGNVIDCLFYGVIFSASTPMEVAHFGGSYASPFMGRVVDMFYFPLFQWNGIPSFLSFLVDSNNYFFGAIFNLADSYISVAVLYILIFQQKFFIKEGE
ncbi:MAG: signal peptidase II [Rikenellaceae bacterium]